ncbi:hypothetical protein K3495_g8573 [Podosphaera aphanis]|nr:hypothetical protein K3495_g8573 [Podosphaera aphanis]
MSITGFRQLSRGRLVLRKSSSCTRRLHTNNTIQEDEIVILKSIVNDRAEPILVGPLKPGSFVSYKKLKNIIRHENIIGQHINGLVRAKNRNLYRIDRPTLAEYTDKSSRLVTPIYSQDANVIISLLDLHPTAPGVEAEKLEIFEAGTGTGALTLYLARAIYGANSLAPRIPPDILSPNPVQCPESQTYEEWRAQRRAIIHTLDIHEERSRHAAANIKKYRNGMYFPHIDFHTGCIEALLSEKLALKSNTPFLDHAILDLPSPESYMKIVSQAVKDRGILLIFVPSITQINKAALFVRKMALPWSFENVLELGGSLATGGREWDVKFVRTRAFLKAIAAKGQKVDDDPSVVHDAHKDCELMVDLNAANEDINSDSETGDFKSTEGLDEEKINSESTSNMDTHELRKDVPSQTISDDDDDDGGWQMVCRPKVGVRVTNGGFVGIWRKVGVNK